MASSNSTCPLPKNAADLLITGDKFVGPLTFQHVILIIAFAFAAAASWIDYFNIIKHLRRYTEPGQQRQIIRIIYVPTIFASLSAFSILNYNVAIYLAPIRDLYETFAIAALFLLFTEYVAPDPNTRDAYFANLENLKRRGGMFSKDKGFDILPGGCLRWYKAKYLAVFGYVIVQIVTTVAQGITQTTGAYCDNSLDPKFAHIWITVIQSVAVTVAVGGIITFYGRLKNEPRFTQHKPLLKLLSLKLIVGVNFIQTVVFSLLTGQDAIHGTHNITGKDIAYGIPNLLVAFEQVFFAIFFHYAYRSREYHESEKTVEGGHHKRMGVLRAAAHASNPTDIIMGMVNVFSLLSAGIRPNDSDEFGSQKGRQGRGGRQQYNRLGGGDMHLEPMGRGRPQYGAAYDGPNQYRGPNTIYTPPSGSPPDTTYVRSDSYTGYRPPPEYDTTQDYSEHTSLNPKPQYQRSHSEDPSVDATSMRQIV